jgi:class 3 adenylate cyclase
VAERGTATNTIVWTDVVGSTEARGRLGEVTADELFRAVERHLTQLVTAHDGRVVKVLGDGIMAAFDAASDAVSAAIAMQRGLTQVAPNLQIRVGIAAGDVSWEDGDCFGLPVIVASRLEGAAEPGQVLVSQVVRWLAGDRAGDRYEALGPRTL